MATPLGCSSSRSRRKPPPPTSDSGGSRPPPPPSSRPPPPPPPPVNCGNRQNFDSDGDGISDRVERNNSTNRYADLRTGRCDDDPSKPVGKPSGGDL
ncbi:MAG: hypothetical protein AAFV29_20620, partial [Myxococcota bacterium]